MVSEWIVPVVVLSLFAFQLGRSLAQDSAIVSLQTFTLDILPPTPETTNGDGAITPGNQEDNVSLTTGTEIDSPGVLATGKTATEATYTTSDRAPGKYQTSPSTLTVGNVQMSTPRTENDVRHQPVPEPSPRGTAPPTLDPAQMMENPMVTRGPCDLEARRTCNITNYERCFSVHQGRVQCMCVSGYEKDKQGRCIVTQYYRVILPTFLSYTSDLEEKGDTYIQLVTRAKNAIQAAIESTRLSSIYLGVRLTDLVRTKADDISMIFDVMMPDPYSPGLGVMTRDISEGIRQVLVSTGSPKSYKLADSEIPVLHTHLDALSITVPDPCSSSRYNYCDDSAKCHRIFPMGFDCSCRHRYTDLSPDRLNIPGEVCKLNCRCQNGGTCDATDDGDFKCRCESWYLGQECGVDGKVLFITLCVVIGSLILLALMICCICMKKMRQNENREKKLLDAAVSRDFPAVVTYKLPSSWLEQWSHLHEPNPRPQGKENLGLETLDRHPLSTFPRSGELLTIPRPHLRKSESEQKADTVRDQTYNRWSWPVAVDEEC